MGVNVENFAEALDASSGVDAHTRFPDHRDFAVGVSLIGIAHKVLRVTAEFYQGMRGKLGTCGVGRLVVEEAGEFGVFNDHGGIALDRVEVFLLEAVAGFGRDKHLSGQRNSRGGVLGGDRFLGGESFVDAHDKFGNVMEPSELRVVDDQAEELTGVDGAVLALVVTALHVEKSLVELEERQAESNQFLACRRVAVPGR